MIDNTEENVEETQLNVSKGAKFLEKASRYKVATYPIAGAMLGTCIGGPIGLIAGLKIGGLTALGCGILGKSYMNLLTYIGSLTYIPFISNQKCMRLLSEMLSIIYLSPGFTGGALLKKKQIEVQKLETCSNELATDVINVKKSASCPESLKADKKHI